MDILVLTQKTLANKGLRALNVLLNKTSSTLNYSGEVWCFGKSKEIERIHLKFCKRLLNVKSSTSSNDIYSELGRYPLFINRFVKIIKYWCNIVSSANILFTKM